MTTATDMAPELEGRSSGRVPVGRFLTLYRVALVIVVSIVTVLAVQSAGTRLLARRVPDLALRISPSDTLALSMKAHLVMTRGLRDPAEIVSARNYAERALRRDLTRDDALVVLAATTIGQDADQRAIRFIRQAENLTRRNLAAELWLIENSVRKESVRGALHHFDIALRTSKVSGAILYPVLRNALEDPELTGPIAQTVDAAPWRNQFLQYAVSVNWPTPALAALFARQRTLVPYQGTDLKGALVGQLAASKFYDAAAQLALGKAAGLVEDPEFAREGGYPPFAWQLTDSAGLVARRLYEGTKSQLQVQADDGFAGIIAFQLIHASPGPYLLSVEMAEEAPGLSLLLECANNTRELARMPIALRKAILVAVPTGCPYQTLSIVVSSSRQGPAEWRLTRVDLSPTN